jgi:DNA-binding response OmpR family regulator
MKDILIIEDDDNLGSSLKKILESEGYSVDLCQTIAAGRDTIADDHKILILDWMLPDGQGIDFLKELRKSGELIPVIMLTARVELIDKIIGLESGANDYMTKPFEARELVARIRVQLRDADSRGSIGVSLEHSSIVVNRLKIDLEKREVCFKDRIIELTKMEFELLKLLAESPGRVFSRDEILNKVWGYENYPTTRTVDTHVLQLRQKISDDIIETMRGIGYRLKK